MREDFIPEALKSRYDFRDYGHALEILNDSFPVEWGELCESMEKLVITKADLLKAGGNESPIPPKFDAVLYPKGWREIKISGDLIVKLYPRQAGQRKFAKEPFEIQTNEQYIDGHNIDFIKGRVAFDLEWNSKDQTFDRDLLAMRTYHECGLIDVGIILTRSTELQAIFKHLGIGAKYGASTTHLNKLIPRLDSRRNGGCPILAIGIKRPCIIDVDTEEKHG